jgi:hypothetical protein
MKILDCKIGDYLYEKGASNSDPFTAGRIAAISESTVKSDVVYVLLQSDEGEYTIYSCLSSCSCQPRLARFVPMDNMIELSAYFSKDAVRLPKPEKKCKEPLPVHTPIQSHRRSRREDDEEEENNEPVCEKTQSEPASLPLVSPEILSTSSRKKKKDTKIQEVVVSDSIFDVFIGEKK